MVWLIAIVIIGYVLFRFFTDLNKDNYDLQSQSLEEKFKFIVSRLNEVAFNGKGNVTNLDKRSFNLYESDSNQIINFTYSTGHLTLTWKYKYFQKEVVHEKVFRETRNLSLFEQQKIADIMISEMELKIENHKLAVIRGI
ncbi:MAG: hypothetical protein IPK10_03035 [Bacteroidetes bacterium]|nr:hypothetical protein [Bacteroidota bacterium]